MSRGVSARRAGIVGEVGSCTTELSEGVNNEGGDEGGWRGGAESGMVYAFDFQSKGVMGWRSLPG